LNSTIASYGMPTFKKAFKPQSQATIDQFFLLRGKAIATFAAVEQSQCLLFSHLSEMEFDVATMVFFKITTTGVSDILERLLEKKYGTTYNKFWKSLEGLFGQIVQQRNNIVHWSVTNIAQMCGEAKLGLTPNDNWTRGRKIRAIDLSDLIGFTKKCDFVSRLCTDFSMFLRGYACLSTDSERKTWLHKFSRKVDYDPHNNLPQVPTVKEY
jgi:hypothetical protein